MTCRQALELGVARNVPHPVLVVTSQSEVPEELLRRSSQQAA